MNTPRALPTERTPRLAWWLLAITGVAALALRIREALRVPMWADEVYTLWASRDGLDHALAISAGDVHPPLHFVLVWLWAAIGGEGTLWMRGLSIACGTATVLATFGLGRALFGWRAGLVAATLLALHPQHIYFSQELRVYAFLWLVLTFVWWTGARWLQEGKVLHAAGYVATAALALYTHYFSGLLLAFAGAAGLAIAWRVRGAPGALHWIGLHLLVALMFLPQLPAFVEQSSRLTSEHWIRAEGLIVLYDLARHTTYSAVYMVPVIAFLVLWPLARPGHRGAILAACWILAGPVALSWFATEAGAHLFNERYMYYGLPLFVALIAWGLVALPARIRWVAVAAILLFAGRSVALKAPFPESAALAEVSRVIEAGARPGDVVVSADPHSLFFMAHNRPHLGLHRMLWLDPPVPYYFGGRVIPDSFVVGEAWFDSLRASGTRWWGVFTEAPDPTRQASRTLLNAAADGSPELVDMVLLWSPADAP